MPARSDAAADHGSHALVIGASISGLLAARALSEFFDRVTVVDRDRLPAGPQPRKGVPQSRQVHALLYAGAELFEELLPGFVGDLKEAGAASGDMHADHRWFLDGYRLLPADSGLTGYGASRPLLEDLVRRRVAALPGVTIIDGRDAEALLTAGPGRVTGVRLAAQPGGAPAADVQADLVVDAAGRASRSGAWLKELGYEPAPETVVRADVVYVTRHYRSLPHHLNGRLGATIPPYPGQLRAGAVIRQEEGAFALMLAGMLGENPPTDDAGMLAFAQSLDGPDVAEVIASARPGAERWR